MKIFVYEHICGGGFAEQDLPGVLRREGWAMLSTVVADFAALPDVNVAATIDGRFAAEPLPAKTTLVDTENQCESEFNRLAAAADWTLVIAPEFDDILHRLTARVEPLGGRLLGSTPDAVRLGADKLKLADHWTRNDVPTIPTRSVDLIATRNGQCQSQPADFPAVLKPRFGAGSVQTHLLRDEREFKRFLTTTAAEDWPHPAILQPYVEGDPISMSFLIGNDQIIPLPATRQHLTDDGRFIYLGGEGPLDGPGIDAARKVAQRAVQSIEGLRGYVGIDLILSPAGPVVVELNPRPTTSYVGLRRMCKQNLAGVMLDLAHGRSVDPVCRSPNKVTFTTEGTLDARCTR